MRRGCRALGLVLITLIVTVPLRAQAPPPDLPRYDLHIRLDTNEKVVHLRERVTWTNRHARPAEELVFTVCPLYRVAGGEVPVLAKTVELLRQSPSVALISEPAGQLNKVKLGDAELAFVPRADLPTAIVVALPKPVGQGESVTVELDYRLTLPNKQGRWGYWDDVCYMANWMPQLAFYDEKGWQPTPFIPWHQPFFHEAGVMTASITLPKDQVLAAPSAVAEEREADNGWKEIILAPAVLRDFALVSSARFKELKAYSGGVNIRVVALPEHAHYAQVALRVACEAMATYTTWFGPYPYPLFTVAESFFPWNGNECSGMVWLDHRVFQMPKLAEGYVDYLLSHEICHQWWYGLIGTNGYAETFMDEGPATYFSHRLMNGKWGKNNTMLNYPKGFTWMPNISRENYRWSGWYSAVQRGESSPAVQPIDSYRHIYDLFAGAYDRGSRIWMMIEERLGEAAFFDFTRTLARKYAYRILRSADLQRELEAYTGRSWDEFFKEWVYGSGVTDWKVESVKMEKTNAGHAVEVLVKQQREIDEPTVLGIKYPGGDGYAMRIPIVPGAGPQRISDPPAEIEPQGDHIVRVRVQLPQEPEQITIDPDAVLPDADPANNNWHIPVRWRWTPLYTQIDDASLVNDYRQWTIQGGPWIYLAASREPWYARSMLAGLRVGAVRPEHFSGGGFFAYRNDFRDFVVGADGEWNHTPWPKTQVGFHVEQRVAGPIGEDGPNDVTRAVIYGRYVFSYASSLYLNPMHYAEVFGTYQDNAMPFARFQPPGTIRPENATLAGIHYSLNLLTPYWDPEGGFKFDLDYAGGTTDLNGQRGTNRVDGQLTYVTTPPAWTGFLSQTRLAMRGAFAAGWPNEGLYYALGGSTLFRGFDLSERQGSSFWVFNFEWRVPVIRNVEYDVCDHLVGLRGVQLAAFYDVGGMYANGQQVGPVAHAIGGGIRCDLAAFSFIERLMIRIDVAKTLNEASPVQVWFGVMQPF